MTNTHTLELTPEQLALDPLILLEIGRAHV
jgi:hypothetical protein